MTWINYACFQWTADRHLPAAPSKASCRFTAVPQFWFARSAQPIRLGPMHKFHPIISSSIWSAASGNFQYPGTPIFDAHVSLPSNYLITKSFSLYFASARRGSIHFTLRSRQNYLFIVVSLKTIGHAASRLNALCALAPFALACIHDHWCPFIVSQREIIGTHQEDCPHHSRC